MATDKKMGLFDRAVNFVGLAGGIPAVADKFAKVWGVLPSNVQEKISQRMPGIMGYSKVDEQIFNPLLAKLPIKGQREITNFLFTKCQKFQRDDFRVIVAGMEVVRGTPQVVEKKWNESTKKFEERITSKKDDEDLRLMFLERFVEYIGEYGMDEAYNACLATNMFAEFSNLQRIKNSFTAKSQGASSSDKGFFTRTFGVEAQNAANQKIQDALDRRKRR